jgi:hypothetical protein
MTTTTTPAITRYVEALPPPMRDVAARLAALVAAELPGAEGVVWYGHPVWTLASAPAVLVKAYGRHVTLGCWRGQGIDSAGGLTPSGRV